MDNLERLMAIEEIKQLKARYFRFVDTQAWDDFRGLFTDDATVSIPENMPEPLSIQDFMPRVADVLAGGVTVHHGHMPEIEILTPETARAIWAMEDRLYFPPGVRGVAGASEIHGAGHYHETYVRVGGGWLIETLRLTRLRLMVHAQPRAVA